MTKEQKQQVLDKVVADVFHYVDEVKIIKDYFDAIPQKISIASPYLSFREALFHYKKMHEAAHDNDITGLIKQNACIDEHLNRGLKDYATHICTDFYVRIIHEMIDSNVNSVNIVRADLRHIYHGLKNLIVEIRLGGQTLIHFDDNENTWLPKLVDLIKAFDDLMGKHQQLRRLYDSLSIEIAKNI